MMAQWIQWFHHHSAFIRSELSLGMYPIIVRCPENSCHVRVELNCPDVSEMVSEKLSHEIVLYVHKDAIFIFPTNHFYKRQRLC